MTVELAIAFPVFIIVAVIAVNALLFFSQCAAFDNLFRDSVRIYATSPAYGQDYEDSVALIEAALDESFDSSFESLSGFLQNSEQSPGEKGTEASSSLHSTGSCQ